MLTNEMRKPFTKEARPPLRQYLTNNDTLLVY